MWSCSFPQLERQNFSSIDYLPVQTSFPSLQSCNIKLCFCELGPLREFLLNNSSVRDLQLTLYSVDNEKTIEESQSLGQIDLPHLEQMPLSDRAGEGFCLLKILSLPQICMLSLDSVTGVTYTRIASTIVHHTFPVNHLELGVGCSVNPYVTSTLNLFPSVSTLKMNTGKGWHTSKGIPDRSGVTRRNCLSLRTMSATMESMAWTNC